MNPTCPAFGCQVIQAVTGLWPNVSRDRWGYIYILCVNSAQCNHLFIKQRCTVIIMLIIPL